MNRSAPKAALPRSYSLSFHAWGNDLLCGRLFHVALNPVSEIWCTGSDVPVKLGSVHPDAIRTTVSLPTGVNNNCSDPFTRNEAANSTGCPGLSLTGDWK